MSLPPEQAEALAQAGADIDIDLLLHRLAGNRAVLFEVSQLLLDGLPARLENLRKPLESGDLEALTQNAHGLKGTVSNFTTGPLWQLASALEQAAKSGDAPTCKALYSHVVTATLAFRVDLQGKLAALQGADPAP